MHHWLWPSYDSANLRSFLWFCPSPEQQRFLCRHFNDGESGCARSCIGTSRAWMLSWRINVVLYFRCVWSRPRWFSSLPMIIWNWPETWTTFCVYSTLCIHWWAASTASQRWHFNGLHNSLMRCPLPVIVFKHKACWEILTMDNWFHRQPSLPPCMRKAFCGRTWSLQLWLYVPILVIFTQTCKCLRSANIQCVSVFSPIFSVSCCSSCFAGWRSAMEGGRWKTISFAG